MARRQIEYEIDVVTRDAARNLQTLRRESEQLEDALEDNEDAATQVARALDAAAADMRAEIAATARAVDALAVELDGVDMDPRDAVAALKRMGLSAEEVEQDAEQLAAALRNVDSVKVDARDAGFDDLGQAVRRVGDETERADDVTRGYIGGMVGELPGVSDALGPVAEGLGQLTEGALAGEIGINGLITAAGGMAAVGAAVWAVTEAFNVMRDNAERLEERTEAWTEALKETSDVMAAIDEMVTQEDTWTRDQIATFRELGLTVSDVADIIRGGQPALEAWEAEQRAAAGSAAELRDIQVPLRDTVKALDTEIRALGDSTQWVAESQDFFGSRTERLIGVLDELGPSAAAAAGAAVAANLEIADTADDAVEAVQSVMDVYADLNEDLSEREQYLGLIDAFDDMRTAAEEAFTAAEEGADDAAEKQRAAERASIDLRQAVIGYGSEIENIPTSWVTDIVADIDEGNYNRALAQLAELERVRTAPVDIIIRNPEALAGTGAVPRQAFTPAAPSTRPAGSSMVQINTGPGYTARDITELVRQQTTRNGTQN